MVLVSQFYKEIEQVENDDALTESEKRKEINRLYWEARDSGLIGENNF